MDRDTIEFGEQVPHSCDYERLDMGCPGPLERYASRQVVPLSPTQEFSRDSEDETTGLLAKLKGRLDSVLSYISPESHAPRPQRHTRYSSPDEQPRIYSPDDVIMSETTAKLAQIRKAFKPSRTPTRRKWRQEGASEIRGRRKTTSTDDSKITTVEQHANRYGCGAFDCEPPSIDQIPVPAQRMIEVSDEFRGFIADSLKRSPHLIGTYGGYGEAFRTTQLDAHDKYTSEKAFFEKPIRVRERDENKIRKWSEYKPSLSTRLRYLTETTSTTAELESDRAVQKPISKSLQIIPNIVRLPSQVTILCPMAPYNPREGFTPTAISWSHATSTAHFYRDKSERILYCPLTTHDHRVSIRYGKPQRVFAYPPEKWLDAYTLDIKPIQPDDYGYYACVFLMDIGRTGVVRTNLTKLAPYPLCIIPQEPPDASTVVKLSVNQSKSTV
ncbi:hypothetical protein T265_15984, partial [Opisthorchis viverrini]